MHTRRESYTGWTYWHLMTVVEWDNKDPDPLIRLVAQESKESLQWLLQYEMGRNTGKDVPPRLVQGVLARLSLFFHLFPGEIALKLPEGCDSGPYVILSALEAGKIVRSQALYDALEFCIAPLNLAEQVHAREIYPEFHGIAVQDWGKPWI